VAIQSIDRLNRGVRRVHAPVRTGARRVLRRGADTCCAISAAQILLVISPPAVDVDVACAEPTAVRPAEKQLAPTRVVRGGEVE